MGKGFEGASLLQPEWDQAHIEAERLEHAPSDEMADRLDAVLDHSSAEPHGHPIPGRNGHIPSLDGMPLTELSPGRTGLVLQIRDDTPQLLRYLGDLGIYPGERITVLEVAPFNGPIHARVGENLSESLGDLSGRQIPVVATIGMITDIVQVVGGERVIVTGLMGPGTDPHLYKASEGDVRRLSEADLIFYNGLHLEAQMGEVLEQMDGRGIKTLAVTDGIDHKVLQRPPEFEGQ